MSNEPPDLMLTSTAFAEGEPIPRDYTADGRNDSPPLQWTAPPDGTKCFALLCDDPDAPRGTWVHWVIYNIPASSRGLSAATPPEPTLPDGTRQGTNSFGRPGYGGPSPPPGPPHRYFFTLYALDRVLDLPSGVTKQQLIEAMQGHELADGRLMGKYGRPAQS
jgi:Raf kinase inhibitor-like YbhB/YbcL family protein